MLDKQAVRYSLAAVAPVFVLMLWGAHRLRPQDEAAGWPRAITGPQGSILIYQPQLESFEGNALTGRAAVSVTPVDGAAPVFGVVWMTARVETDRDTRTVDVLDVNVDRVGFPNATDDQRTRFAALLERELPDWELTLSLDRLLASLAIVERERAVDADLRAEPPRIVFDTEPTILVSIDGEPRMLPIEDTNLQRMVNTPFTILFAEDTRTYYLHAGDETWYTAATLDGAWQSTTAVPSSVSRLAPPPQEEPSAANPDAQEPATPGPPPRILVATEPTELIVTTGAPEYTPINGTELLYMSNTESDVVLEIQAQRHYVVLSGRWFAAASLAGPWTHVPPDELPATFSDIPPASEMGHLLVSVPGTEAAEEAVLEQQIPQTTAIDRSEATLIVTYDGEPSFESIEDTEMEYAANTDVSVIKVGSIYYACHEAVWFVSGSPNGPWAVADSVPDEVYSMPPSSPVYNVKYVYVYDTTPDVVYVGYYPGYTHSYVYGGTIVYGTGYYYTPWYGTVYYPHHATWGWHVRWNPWYGWGYGFSYSTGPFTFSVGWGGGYGGWWGPVGYRGYAAGYHRGWHEGYGAGARAGYRAGLRAGNNTTNIYRRPENTSRNLDHGPVASNARRPGAVANHPNDVFADRNGNVARRTGNGWEARGTGGWERGSGNAAQRARSVDRAQLDRSYRSRQRGTSRTRNYQRSRGGRRRR